MQLFNSFMSLLIEKMSSAVPQFNKNWETLSLNVSQLFVVFEFECYIKTTFDDLGKALKSSFPEYGISLCPKNKIKRKNRNKITVELDNSLDANEQPKNYTGFEIVSPWISGEDAETVLNRFKKFLDSQQAITNIATGGHINIRFKEDTYLDWLKLFLLSHENSDLFKFERQKNPYTRSVMQVLNNTLARLKTTDNIIQDITTTFSKNKDHSINLLKMTHDYEGFKFGFVEFRVPGNDYLHGRFDLFKKTLRKYMNLMIVAGTSEFETEYKVRLERLKNKAEKEVKKNSESA